MLVKPISSLAERCSHARLIYNSIFLQITHHISVATGSVPTSSSVIPAQPRGEWKNFEKILSVNFSVIAHVFRHSFYFVQNELIATEKIVLHAKDLIKWISVEGVDWNLGLPFFKQKNSSCQCHRKGEREREYQQIILLDLLGLSKQLRISKL